MDVLSEERLFDNFTFDIEEADELDEPIFDILGEDAFEGEENILSKYTEPPFTVSQEYYLDKWFLAFNAVADMPEGRPDTPSKSPSLYDDLVSMERITLYENIQYRLGRCMDGGETFEKYYILDILSQKSGALYETCDEIMRVVMFYARRLDGAGKPMNSILYMEAELTSLDYVKTALPVEALKRYMGIRKLIYIRLLWSMICYEKVMINSKGYLGTRILDAETREDIQEIEKEPYTRLIMETANI